MKKRFFVLLLLLFGSSILFAQVEKGKWFVAGYSNFGLDIGTNKSKSGGTTTENYKYSDFYFSPEAGYFVIDKLAAGLFLEFDRYTEKYDDGDKDFDTKIIIGPFVRYYILEYKKLWPYVEGRVGFGSEKYTNNYDSDYTPKWSYFTTKLGAGATYFVTNHVGIDLFMGYDYDAWTDKTDYSNGSKQMSSEDESTEKYGSFEMNIGVVVTIGK
jgi:outer membrane protein